MMIFNKMTNSDWRALILAAAVITMLLLSMGCSYQRKLQRAEKKITRIANKYPELTKVDTITITDVDTFIVQEIHIDTVHALALNETTRVVENERVMVRYYYDTITRNIYHDVHVKGDTIVKTETHQVTNKNIHVHNRFNWRTWLILGVIILAIVSLFRRLFT